MARWMNAGGLDAVYSRPMSQSCQEGFGLYEEVDALSWLSGLKGTRVAALCCHLFQVEGRFVEDVEARERSLQRLRGRFPKPSS